MANLSSLYELLYDDEGSFKENAQSPGSNTYSKRVPVIGIPTMSLTQTRADDQTVQSRRNDSRPGFLGLRGGTISFKTLFPGLMSDPGASTVSETWTGDLLGDGLGGSSVADDGGTVQSATDADTFVTTGATLTPGNGIAVGVKNDGRCDGQIGVISTWSGGNTQLLTALPATPNASDAVRICHALYPTEAEPTVTKRFLCGYTATGAQYHAMGCQLASVTLNLPVESGDLPTIDWVYNVAYWARSTVSIPSAVALPNTDTGVIAGGQFYAQTFGTATRATRAISSLSVSLDMGLIADRGPAASQEPYGNVRGWYRTRVVPTVTYTRAFETTAESDFDADGSSSTHEHFLWQSNATAGRRVAIYMPRLYRVGDKPTVTDQGGLLFQSEMWRGCESTDTTSELTRSCIRVLLG